MPYINSVEELDKVIENGAYTDLGGYPIYFIMKDGAAMSYNAVKEEYDLIIKFTFDEEYKNSKNGDCTQWQILGYNVNWEDPDLYCAHTNDRIPSAYVED